MKIMPGKSGNLAGTRRLRLSLIIKICLIVSLLISSGCVGRIKYLTTDDKIYIIKQGEKFTPIWGDGAVAMSKGKFSSLFDQELYDNEEDYLEEPRCI